MDLPQVCMGISHKNNKLMRVAIDAGKLLILEGAREEIARLIAEKGASMGDQWAGAEYRQKTLLVLLERLLAESQARKEMK